MPSAHLDEEAIFKVACKIPSLDERLDYLRQVCGDDQTLLKRVSTLLQLHDEDEGFLETPAVGNVAPLDLPISETVGTVIGRYKLLQKVGEGGFGVVYMAEQREPVRRKVALKIIKPGMDTKEVVARFEAERQALALMNHPNVAHVLDGGTTDSGRPYFVMELVRGVPITQYCDEARLTTDERLRLFILVCDAVQHAHQKGIIHRDIKPSNVLVTLQGETPVPKIIDFGVAKATHQQLTEKTVFTGVGQMIGTPMYMSPEQLALSGLDVDTRSDIYSLGVLLYELLTGVPPFDKERLHALSVDEIRHTIREQEPPKPSTRISTLGDRLTTIAAQRHTDRRTLNQQVRGDLDWIVMKAMEKDRTRRYETANSFAHDVRRYLGHEPVEACPPSAAYRFRKFVRRNRARVVAIATAALSLVAMLIFGVIVLAIAFREEKALRDAAQQSQQRAERSELEARRTAYAADIMLAGRAWRDGDVRQFAQLLHQLQPSGTEPDVRGFEWYYLRQLLNAKDFELAGHAGAIHCTCGSADGCWIATAGEDATIRVYDVDTRQMRMTIETGQGEINGLSFSPDRCQIVSAGDDGTAQIWDLETRENVIRIEASSGELYNVLFTPDGKRLISCGVDPAIRLWDIQTGALVGELEGHKRAVEAIALSPDGRLLASASSDETARLWDLESRRRLQTLRGHRGRLSSIAFSPDGEWLATGCLDKTVGIWDAKTGALVTLLHHLDGVQCLAFGPKSQWLAAGDRGGVIKLWPRTWELPDWSFGAHNQVRWCGISPDGKTVVAATWERVLLRDLESGKIRELELDDPTILRGSIDYDPVRVFGISPAGKMLVCLNEVYDADPSSSSGWKRKFKLDEDHRNLSCLAFSPDGHTLVTGMKEGHIAVWDTDTGRRRADWLGHRGGWVNAVAFSSDGKRLASAGCDRSVVIWDCEGRQITEFHHESDVLGLAVSPDGKLLASGARDDRVRLWNLETGECVGTLFGHQAGVDSVVFSPDGSRLASAAIDDGTVRVWDVAARRLLRTYSADADVVSFLPDGKTILTGGTSDLVRFWNLDTDVSSCGQTAKTLKWHDGRVYSVASLAETGRWVSAGQDGRVVVSNPASFATEIEVEHPTDDAAFTLDGRELFVASPDGVHRIDASTGTLTESMPGEGANWCSIAVAPTSGLLAARNFERLRLWDVSKRPAQLRWDTADYAGPDARGLLALSPDGNRLAVVNWTPADAVRLLRTDTGEVEHSYSAHAPHTVAFSPDGTKLAFDSQNELLICDVNRHETLYRLKGHTNSIETIAFSPDGSRIASAGRDRNVLLWEKDGGRLRFTLAGHRDDVLSVAFSPDGRTLATADRGGCLKLWHVATGRELLEIANDAKSICWAGFSPDGRRLAYLFDDELGIRIISAADYEPQEP